MWKRRVFLAFQSSSTTYSGQKFQIGVHAHVADKAAPKPILWLQPYRKHNLSPGFSMPGIFKIF